MNIAAIGSPDSASASFNDTEHSATKGNTSGAGASIPKAASRDNMSKVRMASTPAVRRALLSR
jgi:hypothetical protein